MLESRLVIFFLFSLFSRILRAQIYCHFGYALLLCDCRGSANRGSQFAGYIKYQIVGFGVHYLQVA